MRELKDKNKAYRSVIRPPLDRLRSVLDPTEVPQPWQR
jgi:hypothetical protein